MQITKRRVKKGWKQSNRLMSLMSQQNIRKKRNCLEKFNFAGNGWRNFYFAGIPAIAGRLASLFHHEENFEF